MRLVEAITDNRHKPGRKRHIAHLVGDLPVILMEINPSNGAIVKSYIHANDQILAQHDGDHTAESYFYLHDRLGSVRQLINSYGYVHKYYTYEPFGETIESGGSFDDSFRFTGQYLDAEIGEYYLRARQYNPHIARFTSRDPVFGEFEQPLTLHKYLYCTNDPVNGRDPAGLWTIHVTGTIMGSMGWSGVRQSGIVFDDEGNIGWLNVTGIGAGTPIGTAGITIGATSADTIFHLEEWSVSMGGGGGIGFSAGADIIFGQDFWGVQVTVGGSIPSYIPAEIHEHITHAEVYSSDEIYEAVKTTIEASMFDVTTVGEAYGLLLIWGLMD